MGLGKTEWDRVGRGWTGCDGVGREEGAGPGWAEWDGAGRVWKGLDGVGRGRTGYDRPPFHPESLERPVLA